MLLFLVAGICYIPENRNKRKHVSPLWIRFNFYERCFNKAKSCIHQHICLKTTSDIGRKNDGFKICHVCTYENSQLLKKLIFKMISLLNWISSISNNHIFIIEISVNQVGQRPKLLESTLLLPLKKFQKIIKSLLVIWNWTLLKSLSALGFYKTKFVHKAKF